MELRRFKEENKKKKVIVGTTVITILLLAGIFFYRTFAIYEEKNSFDVIKGQVPDQHYDLMFSFLIEDESGNQTYAETAPEGTNWSVSISCSNGATGIWDYTSWGPKITNLTQARTKCKVIFGPEKPLGKFGINDDVVTSGNGIYEVVHADANITYTSDPVAINNLKKTEYRYAGSSPNNYVTFNNELWRIIGLVNTPEGQRVKIIRNETTAYSSWDTDTINGGYGVNEWSKSDIMKLLNPGYESESVGGSLYWTRRNGICYIDHDNLTNSCDFSGTGLSDEAKSMIDTVTWNTGTNGTTDYKTIDTISFYNYERSNNTGKICNSGTLCNDTVTRTITWNGKVGLIYPSDYGYATSGGSTTNRESCLLNAVYNWKNTNVSDCKNNDWLSSKNGTTMIPTADSTRAQQVFASSSGFIYPTDTRNPVLIYPVVYLMTGVKVVSGEGTSTNPYQLLNA